MPDLIRVILFVLTGTLGYFAVSLVLYGSLSLGLTLDNVPEQFKTLYLGGTMWAWIAGIVLGLGYFFTNKGLRIALLWAPVFIPVLWACGVLAAFR